MRTIKRNDDYAGRICRSFRLGTARYRVSLRSSSRLLL